MRASRHHDKQRHRTGRPVAASGTLSRMPDDESPTAVGGLDVGDGDEVGGEALGVVVRVRRADGNLIYWIDAISFTAVLIALFFLRTRPQKAETRDVSLKAAFEGLRFLRRTPIIMSTMTLDFFATLLGAA